MTEQAPKSSRRNSTDKQLNVLKHTRTFQGREVPKLSVAYGEYQVPVDPRLQVAFNMTVDALSEILEEVPDDDTLQFRLSTDTVPRSKKYATLVPVSLLSEAPRPEGTLPAKFTVHLLQAEVGSQDERKIVEVRTSVRRQIQRPKPGEKAMNPQFIRTVDDKSIILQPEYFSNDPEAVHASYKKDLEEDFRKACRILTNPPGEPIELLDFTPRNRTQAA